MTRDNKLVLQLAVLLSLGLIWSIASVDYLPCHDGPNHIFHAFVENHFVEGGYGAWLEQGLTFTSMGFHMMFVALESVMPWQTALTVALCLMTLIWSWGFLVMCRALDRPQIGLLGFATALCWPLYMGLWSYVLASGFGFWLMALGFQKRSKPPPILLRVAIGAGLLIQAVMHSFATMTTGLVLLVTVLSRTPKGRRLKETAWLGAVSVPALLIAYLTIVAIGSKGFESSLDLDAVDRVRVLGKTFIGGPWWRAWPPVIAALIGIGLALRKGAWRVNVAAISAAILIGMAVVLSFHIEGWEFFSNRFTAHGVMLGAAALPLTQRWVAAVVAWFAAASIGWSAAWHVEVVDRTAVAHAALEADIAKRKGPRLAVVLDHSAGLPDHHEWRQAQFPFYKPLFNLGIVYAVEDGGIPSWFFSTISELHPYVVSKQGRRAFPPVHDPVGILEHLGDDKARAEVMSFIASLGSRYDDVILYGEHQDTATLIARGYEADFHQDGPANRSLAIARFRGCPFTVRFAPHPSTAPLVVECGYSFEQAPSGKWLVGDGSTREIEAARCLCGASWYRAFWDEDRSGDASPGDVFCEGADDRGMFVTDRTPTATVTCARVTTPDP